MKPLSYTQISRYLTCPLWYKLQYVENLKPKERPYLSFGEIIHQCAEYFFAVPVPRPPNLEKLLQFYEKNWISAGYETPEQELQYKAYGQQLLEDFWKIHYPDFKMPLAVEYRFAINIEGVILSGKIDRVDRLPDGVAIVDYKTNQNLFSADQLEQDHQLTFYQLAAETVWRLPVKKLILYHLRSNIPFTCAGRQPDRLKEAKELVLRVASGIDKKVFPAVENSLCAYCDFPQYCPFQKHKYVLEKPPEVGVKNILNGKAANEIVEQYARLQKQKKDIESQIDELKQVICAYCEERGYKRLFGPEHSITFRMVERTGFDEDKVKMVLQPVGLWPRVLKFDPSLVRALLDEDILNPELRHKVEDSRQITSSFAMLAVKALKEQD
jgi:RecB family exonuclease